VGGNLLKTVDLSQLEPHLRRLNASPPRWLEYCASINITLSLSLLLHLYSISSSAAQVKKLRASRTSHSLRILAILPVPNVFEL